MYASDQVNQQSEYRMDLTVLIIRQQLVLNRFLLLNCQDWFRA